LTPRKTQHNSNTPPVRSRKRRLDRQRWLNTHQPARFCGLKKQNF